MALLTLVNTLIDHTDWVDIVKVEFNNRNYVKTYALRKEPNIHQIRNYLHQNTISRIQIYHQRIC